MPDGDVGRPAASADGVPATFLDDRLGYAAALLGRLPMTKEGVADAEPTLNLGFVIAATSRMAMPAIQQECESRRTT